VSEKVKIMNTQENEDAKDVVKAAVAWRRARYEEPYQDDEARRALERAVDAYVAYAVDLDRDDVRRTRALSMGGGIGKETRPQSQPRRLPPRTSGGRR